MENFKKETLFILTIIISACGSLGHVKKELSKKPSICVQYSAQKEKGVGIDSLPPLEIPAGYKSIAELVVTILKSDLPSDKVKLISDAGKGCEMFFAVNIISVGASPTHRIPSVIKGTILVRDATKPLDTFDLFSLGRTVDGGSIEAGDKLLLAPDSLEQNKKSPVRI